MAISPIGTGGYYPPSVSDNAQPAAPTASSAPPASQLELPSKAVQSAEAALSANQVHDAVNEINKVVQSMNNNVRFSVDGDTGINVIKVVDTSTNEIIRQFPSEEIIDLAKSLDKLRGLVIRQTA